MAGTITGLVVQKRNPKRVNVYLDGAYAFPLDMAIVLKWGLKNGQQLSDLEISALTAADDVEKAYLRAVNLLSYRPRSVAEVRRNLQAKKTDPETIEAVVARLTQNGLLDDAAFARFWVENRSAFSPRSGRLMSYELRQKGVATGDIETALPSEDREGAREAAMRRARSLAALDYESFRKKLLPYLQRRGFGYETAAEAVNAAWQESTIARIETSPRAGVAPVCTHRSYSVILRSEVIALVPGHNHYRCGKRHRWRGGLRPGLPAEAVSCRKADEVRPGQRRADAGRGEVPAARDAAWRPKTRR